MGGRLLRVRCIRVALDALLLLLLAGVAVPCKNVSGVDLCDDFLNSTGCDCDIVDVQDCLIHMTCDANSTYRGSVPNFSKLEEHNFSLFLTIQHRQLRTFNVSFLGEHPLLETVELRDNGLHELVGSLPPRHSMQSLAIINNELSSIGDHVLEGLKVSQLDLTNNSFTAVPSVALGSMEEVHHLLLSYNPLGDLPARAFNMTTLQSLDVSNCNIATIAPMAFVGMKDLSRLDLKNNQLTRIEAHYFTDLSREGSVLNHNSLTALFLEFNMITDIEPCGRESAARREIEMKRLITLLALTLLVASLCFAGSVTGYVTDEKCATAGKHGADHAKCAAGCIGGGATIVLVTEDGKIYEVADSTKLKDHAGHKVMVEGKVEGMKVTSIDKVTMPS